MATLSAPQCIIRPFIVRRIIYNGKYRQFHASRSPSAASNFSMPAMSPTMTEGNIANWNIQEGQKFATGDVLLEIETDKAQMDVEAQEDGQLAKIIEHAGAKGVKVGSRIAIIAEEDDDLSTLELPADEPRGTSQPDSAPSAQEAPTPKATDKPPQPSRPNSTPTTQTYPLYPSVAQLLKLNGLSMSEVDKIPASGPKGRLLKGDVLSYLGTIADSYSSQQSARIAKLGHLDLSNVQPAPQNKIDGAEQKKPELRHVEEVPQPRLETEVTLPISLASAINVQKRVKESLGIDLPLSTFVARATEIANQDLPRSQSKTPTADELFVDILGVNNVPASAAGRGRFVPQISSFQQHSATLSAKRLTQTPDVYDLLTGKTASFSSRLERVKATPAVAVPPSSIFSVTVAKGDEKRARVFLERVKTILQSDAGQLIL